MTIEERIEASKIPVSTNIVAGNYAGKSSPLVSIKPRKNILVDPIWNSPTDVEGSLYAKYIAENPLYEDVYIREPINAMLDEAASYLPDNWSLLINAGHRPVVVQKLLFGYVKEGLMSKNTNLSETELDDLTRNYVADPSVKMPAHCCGAAVDVDAFDTVSNTLVDFGSPVNLENEISHLHTSLINHEQRQNRMILLTAMLKAGFASDFHEWWHYSYGDSQWAVFYKQNEPLFDLIEYE